jgi:hypothetical protein
MITPKGRTIDHMVVGERMFDAERWVETRLGHSKISLDGRAITITDAIRPPYTYGEFRAENRAPAYKGDYILHNGYGQFRIFTKLQFDYWYQEKE